MERPARVPGRKLVDIDSMDLAGHFGLAKPTLARHFSVLREAGLIQGDKNGVTITYHLNVSVLEEALWALLGAFHINHGNSEPSKES